MMKKLLITMLVTGLAVASPAWAAFVEAPSTGVRLERSDGFVVAQNQSDKKSNTKKESKGSAKQKQAPPDRGAGS